MNHHGAGLRSLTGSPALSYALAFDHRAAELSDQDAAMLDYAVKLTRSPASIGARDVDGLRAAGFTDRGVLDICQVTAYYNYVNRLADGLGVELEESWTPEALTMNRAEFEEAVAHRRRAHGERP